jgi:tyrosine-protein kinase Etk/Wzc
MNEKQVIATAPEQSAVENAVNFIDILIVFAKHKRIILGVPLLAAVAALAVSFALPNSYQASTKLLPPQQAQSGAAALLAQLGGPAGAVAGVTGLKGPNDLYLGMLKSRTIADKLIKKFELNKVYNTNSPEEARKSLAENTVITSGKDGLITIDVEDRDKKLVAPLANAYVDELLKLTKVFALTEASQRRMFFERQLELSKNNLATAEMTLKGALDTHGVISVDSDSRAIVETVGRLRAQISAKEIQLSSMQAFVTTSNPDYKRAQEELISLRTELSKLENGRPAVEGQGKPAGDKQIGLENIKILRDVKYHQMLYELLSKQYELARLDEAKDTSVIQVLDSAIEPERKFKPRRAIIILLSAALAFCAAVAWAFISEIKQKVVQLPMGAVQWATLKSHLRFR